MQQAGLRKYCNQVQFKGPRKGRSESRQNCRDEKLVARFYYHAEICKLNYSVVLRNLSNEFDIDENVVRTRMKIRSDIIDRLFAEKPSISSLRKKYPYYSW